MNKISDKPVEHDANGRLKLIITIGDRCKVCYTCVRDCPAKAIKIINGQAEVIPERCIGCGNCINVCSQNAKQYASSVSNVMNLLAADTPKAALVAPSFPAEFTDYSHKVLVAMLRKCGFDIVSEVAFGADIVAGTYRELIDKHPEKTFIGTTCPGIVAFVEKYHPDLLDKLAPVASPMVATARALRILHGNNLNMVFIGPCIAKKAEAVRDDFDLVDEVLTFSELRQLFNEYKIRPEKAGISEFDPPNPELGALFPLSGGILQAADMREDLLNADIICADGKNNFEEALKEIEKGSFAPRLLELLCCKGCIQGAGMSTDISAFARRKAVGEYASCHRVSPHTEHTRNPLERYRDILEKMDLSVTFRNDDHRIPAPSEAEIRTILNRMGKFKPDDELDCEACGYKTCREHAIAIHKGLAESEMCLPYTIERLKSSLNELCLSHSQLEETKQALFNAEKLASMGQLSAGIAHEINNPLGVILLNAQNTLDAMNPDNEDFEDVALIVEQAERCRKIVSGLLNFARKNKVIRQPINAVEHLEHSLTAIVKPRNIAITLDASGVSDPEVEIDRDQITQVYTNLIVNAIEAMQPDGGCIQIVLSDTPASFSVTIEDEGPGIPEEHRSKIFEPFFTTKQMGKGTGLGLAVTYGIIKMHHGNIRVESCADPSQTTFTRFMMTFPRKGETINDNR